MSGAEWAAFLAVALLVCELARLVSWVQILRQMQRGQRAMWRVGRHRSAGDERRARALLAAARRTGFASLRLLAWLLVLMLPLLLVAVAQTGGWIRPDLLDDMLSVRPTLALVALAVLHHRLRDRRAGR